MSIEDGRTAQWCVDRFLAEYPPATGLVHACPYLPGRAARNEGFVVSQMSAATYHALLERGFRRSGRLIYRPACMSCRACRQLRVLVDEFQMTRSLRRVRRKNRDVRVTATTPPEPSDEKWRMFHAYLKHQHDGQMLSRYEQFIDFLYDSPVPSFEFTYRVGRRLVGVSVADRCEDGLSSVYMFFDPAERRRSLGTFSILWEIEHCRENGIPHYYLGYFVDGSATMAYKERFRPHEVLLADSGTWQRVDA